MSTKKPAAFLKIKQQTDALMARLSGDAEEQPLELVDWRNYLRATNRQDVLFQETIEDNKGGSSSMNSGTGQTSRLALYQVLEPLGLGAAGCTVVKVRKRSTGGIFALKILSKKIQHYRRLFNTEVKILQMVKHENTVEIEDAFEDALNYYMVMHFCAGGDLFDQLESHPSSFTEPVTAHVVQQLLKGIHFCHVQGIVHRDLKPANIVITEKLDSLHLIEAMAIKIIDFGVAMQCPLDKEEVKATMTGTKHYMAPEILTSGSKPVDALKASDLWSIGVIMFVLLTYSLPFYGKTDDHINQAIRKAKVVFPEDQPKNRTKVLRRLSPGAKDLIQRLLVKDWRQRLTAEQAFAHPWIQYHNTDKKETLQNSLQTAQEMQRARRQLDKTQETKNQSP